MTKRTEEQPANHSLRSGRGKLNEVEKSFNADVSYDQKSLSSTGDSFGP